jgi:high-affinity Fe2+/Pb2+ permease
MGLVSLFAIFLTDSCGTGTNEAMVCDTDYFGSVIIGYWIALVVLIVATPISMAVATTTKRAVWPWAVGGAALSALATAVFFALISR